MRPAALEPRSGRPEHVEGPLRGANIQCNTRDDIARPARVAAKPAWRFRRLSGDDIPSAGRTVAVEDAFDTLTHDRPYRGAQTVSQSMREIVRGGGLPFDQKMVEALETIVPHLDFVGV